MLFRFPKNDREYVWTSHSKSKMLQYRISEQKIKIILNSPQRRETGIALRTVAVMKRNDTPRRKEELWVMYQTLVKSDKRHAAQKKIISVWRYPGVSAMRSVPLPEGLLEELGRSSGGE